MRKLSTLIRRENCFFTKDGQTLRTVQDLLEYLVNCDEDTYSFHVNSQKNDFASWVSNVLLFPELASSLKLAKDLPEARDALMEFFQVFDYRSKSIPEDKAFHTVDDFKLKNLQELYYYINNCDDGSFSYHCNPQKNDFANWISDVLIFPELSMKVRMTQQKQEMIRILKEFLLASKAGANPEYERYINERLVHEEKKDEEKKDEKDGSVSSVKKTEEDNKKMSLDGSNVQTERKDGEEKIDLSKKFEYVREEEPEKEPAQPLDKNAFHQFTDEELERFVAFSHTEKTIDDNVKVEYLRSLLQELKNMVRDLRRAEKDPLVADLLLRAIEPKIQFYSLSKNLDDYNHIIRLMKDVQKEIEDCSEQQSYNIADEIFKDLRLQGIALKKA